MDYKVATNGCIELLLQSLLDSYDQLVINLTNNVSIVYISFDNMVDAVLQEESRHKSKEDRLESLW